QAHSASYLSRLENLEKQMSASANAVRFPEKKCKNCQRTGHVAEECFRKGGGKEGQFPSWWKGKREATERPSTANATAASNEKNPEVAELTQFYGLSATSHDKTGDEIYADTGASDHFFRKREDFATY
ncbi:hypothetical protein GGU10DRAFT_231250, partial [Lentinula aff. detonsa]